MEIQRGINNYFEQLIPQTILRDRERFKSKSPYFYQNTLSELNYGLEALVKNSVWIEHYHDFINNMVFQKDKSKFEDTLLTLEKLSTRALQAIDHYVASKEQGQI